MDDRHFDAFSRSLAVSGSRRGVLRVLTAITVGSVLGGRAVAAASPKTTRPVLAEARQDDAATPSPVSASLQWGPCADVPDAECTHVNGTDRSGPTGRRPAEPAPIPLTGPRSEFQPRFAAFHSRRSRGGDHR